DGGVSESRVDDRRLGERTQCGIGALAAQDQVASQIELSVRLPDQTDAPFRWYCGQSCRRSRRKHVDWGEARARRRLADDGWRAAHRTHGVAARSSELEVIGD